MLLKSLMLKSSPLRFYSILKLAYVSDLHLEKIR